MLATGFPAAEANAALLFSFVASILGYGLEHNLGKVIGVCGQTESLDAKQQQSKSK